jgi:hypothetical protein
MELPDSIKTLCKASSQNERLCPETLKEHQMSLFLSRCPLWLTAFLIVALPTIAAMYGPALIRRRVALERLTINNEIAGFKFATVGVLYAVLVAFAIIMVWERFADAESAVAQEAGAATVLYRLASGTDPEAVAMRRALDNYLALAIERDWPQMEIEGKSNDVTRALDGVYATAVRLAQSGSRPSAILFAVFNQLDALTQARRSRLHLAIGIVPPMLWVVLTFGAVLTVGFTFFFGTKNLRAQIMMTGILSLVVFMSLFVIVSINHPFTGPVHVDSEQLRAVLAEFGRS